jgi:hypothetical protein
MRFFNSFIAVLVTITFSLNANAATSINTQSNSTTAIEKVEGGPRTIIQNMTDIIVEQPTATNLYITIVNSGGAPVIEAVTQDKKTLISIAGLAAGTYTVETVDDYNNLEVFVIVI